MAIINGKVYDWEISPSSIPGLSVKCKKYPTMMNWKRKSLTAKGNGHEGYGEGNYKSEGKLSLMRDGL
ncbi:hypothetical protein WJ0W_006373 [Paenibacillus melissococcoides]|uniref:Uncharacterized protein n=1 Tax=Paenibacillus melissococcoides TaxID=2912268 RepID=A0ABN8UDA7_9BACL|nr:hypothetical protein [Paenibacillus melissococcoides]CAH8249187.1 hypothetical protein WJ0W_006373 [Paenibacillus melissococcoides]